MESEKNKPSEKIDKVTLANLKNEGVEIEDSSRHVDENEFSPDVSTTSPENQEVKIPDEETKKILADIAIPAIPEKKEPLPKTETVSPVNTSIIPPPTQSKETIKPPSVNDPSIHQLRTFRMDAEEAVRDQHVSKAGIAIAEQKKKDSNPIEYVNEHSSNIPLIISIFIFVLILLLGSFGYFYVKTQSSVKPPITTNGIHSIISPDKILILPAVTNSDSLTRISETAKDISGTVGSITFIALSDFGTTTKQIPITSVLRNTFVPERLVRSLTSEYMFGIHIFDGTAPFIILKTSFFQNAYPGMLEWEKDMRNGLLPIIQIGRPDVTSINTNNDIFTDKVISNKDVRELDDTNGVPIILYTFVDKNTILITTNEKSLKELLNKLLAVRVIQ
ncbi:MAG: hypothetical protein COV01_00595 [Candidatus Taylorbacteria bacterium CG10_big_fil_rev_8_21_14_0_10_41_48]|uniref:Uncharacterized protein n=1 Tax=Candidatus Taylorbacteria bacterium CG10_big_fil_rev_8_21_14_0_10_41_48 TaxID=1975024 RepID=A0A2M8LD43_9BACT|nr:MAG: hypothetical protein COV01_00595 [Candidatus Taylorbacteria bacterium CG10_big_fil_rev_8_21_14_0_10_41_48]